MPERIIDFLKIICIHKQEPSCFFRAKAICFLQFSAMVKKHSSSHDTRQFINLSLIFFIRHILINRNQKNHRNHIQRQNSYHKLYLQKQQIPGNHIGYRQSMPFQHIGFSLGKIDRCWNRHIHQKSFEKKEKQDYLSWRIRIIDRLVDIQFYILYRIALISCPAQFNNNYADHGKDRIVQVIPKSWTVAVSQFRKQDPHCSIHDQRMHLGGNCWNYSDP
jgi:hypothetical protein